MTSSFEAMVDRAPKINAAGDVQLPNGVIVPSPYVTRDCHLCQAKTYGRMARYLNGEVVRVEVICRKCRDKLVAAVQRRQEARRARQSLAKQHGAQSVTDTLAEIDALLGGSGST